jgi:ribosomal protein L37AE/L43A
MTKRTKKVGVTGKYGTRYVVLSPRPLEFETAPRNERNIRCRIRRTQNRISKGLGTCAINLERRGNADRRNFRLIDTVPPSESKSRRWKSHNTPNTSAHSAERPPSRDTQSESGTASHATRLLLEEPTLSRMYNCWTVEIVVMKGGRFLWRNTANSSATEPPPPLLCDPPFVV